MSSFFGDYVEGVVGHVRAAEARKDLMREELLAHLAEVFRQEAASLGEGRGAAERAVRRLGEPDELTASLQASVPSLERVLWTPLPFTHAVDALDRAFHRRDGETPVRHAARVTRWFVAGIAPCQLLGIAAAAAVKGGRVDVAVTATFAVASLMLLGLGAFLAPLLCEGMSRSLRADAIRRRRLVWPVLYAATSSLAVIVLVLSFVLIAERGSGRGPLFPRTSWPRLLILSLVAPPIVALTAKSSQARRRRSEEWEIPGSPA